jgi:hypothetical protein
MFLLFIPEIQKIYPDLLYEILEDQHYVVLVPAFARVVFASGGEPSFHLTRNDLLVDAARVFGFSITGAADALACFTSLDCVNNLIATLLGANLDPAATPAQTREWRAELSVPSPASSLLQLVVPEEEDEVPSTLSNRCSMNCLVLIQSCFLPPFSCSWDAALYRQHTPWPPPTELWLVNCDDGLRPLPWPSFNCEIFCPVSLWSTLVDFGSAHGSLHFGN